MSEAGVEEHVGHAPRHPQYSPMEQFPVVTRAFEDVDGIRGMVKRVKDEDLSIETTLYITAQCDSIRWVVDAGPEIVTVSLQSVCVEPRLFFLRYDVRIVGN